MFEHHQCSTHLISDQRAALPLALGADALRNAARRNPARLRHHDVAVLASLARPVQDELRQLRGLAAAGAALQHGHRVRVDRAHDLRARADDRQVWLHVVERIAIVDGGGVVVRWSRITPAERLPGGWEGGTGFICVFIEICIFYFYLFKI